MNLPTIWKTLPGLQPRTNWSIMPFVLAHPSRGSWESQWTWRRGWDLRYDGRYLADYPRGMTFSLMKTDINLTSKEMTVPLISIRNERGIFIFIQSSLMIIAIDGFLRVANQPFTKELAAILKLPTSIPVRCTGQLPGIFWKTTSTTPTNWLCTIPSIINIKFVWKVTKTYFTVASPQSWIAVDGSFQQSEWNFSHPRSAMSKWLHYNNKWAQWELSWTARHYGVVFPEAFQIFSRCWSCCTRPTPFWWTQKKWKHQPRWE